MATLFSVALAVIEKKMKYLIFIILLILSTSFVSAQNLDKDLVSTFYRYRKLIEDKNYDKGLDYYHKDFLKYIPKKVFEKEFEKFNNNLDFDYYVTGSKIISKSEIINTDEKSYCLIKYGAYSHLVFSDTISKERIEEKIKYYKLLYNKNSEYIESTNEIINYKKFMIIGIFNGSWFFIPYKTKLKPYMNIWLPEEIVTKLLENI